MRPSERHHLQMQARVQQRLAAELGLQVESDDLVVPDTTTLLWENQVVSEIAAPMDGSLFCAAQVECVCACVRVGSQSPSQQVSCAVAYRHRGRGVALSAHFARGRAQIRGPAH